MVTPRQHERTVDYAFLLGGVLALIFGAVLLFRQHAAMGVAALLLGLWWLIQGGFLLFSVLIDPQDRLWKVVLGVLGGSAGLVVLANPVQTAEFLGSGLATVLGVVGGVTAGIAVYGSFRGGGMSSMLFGVVSGAIGALLLVYPEGSFATMVTVTGVILIIHGLSAISIAVTTR
jgi:uncharacterized membrane protein HdeD (DUF308 family)